MSWLSLQQSKLRVCKFADFRWTLREESGNFLERSYRPAISCDWKGARRGLGLVLDGPSWSLRSDPQIVNNAVLVSKLCFCFPS